MSSEELARFRASYRRARRDLDRLTRRTARDLEGLVRDLRGFLTGRLGLAAGVSLETPFTIEIQAGIAAEIQQSLATLRQGAIRSVQAAMPGAFDLGSAVTSRAFNSVGVPLFFPSVTPAILTTLTAATSDIITDLIADLGGRIDAVLRRGALGLKPISSVIEDIAGILRTSEVRVGRRLRVQAAFRAEAIARVEIGRIYSNAQQAASEQLMEVLPDLRKRWVTVLGKRPEHREVERRYAVGGEIGPIAIPRRFEVRDLSRVGRTGFLTLGGRAVQLDRPRQRRAGRIITNRMLYPRDPAGSVGSIVGCTCIVVEVLPELEEAQRRVSGRVLV